jgi:hypothetical protein
VAAANGDNETATRLHCRSSLCSYDLCTLSRDSIGIREEFNFHGIFFQPATVGLCHPPGGKTL